MPAAVVQQLGPHIVMLQHMPGPLLGGPRQNPPCRGTQGRACLHTVQRVGVQVQVGHRRVERHALQSCSHLSSCWKNQWKMQGEGLLWAGPHSQQWHAQWWWQRQVAVVDTLMCVHGIHVCILYSHIRNMHVVHDIHHTTTLHMHHHQHVLYTCLCTILWLWRCIPGYA